MNLTWNVCKQPTQLIIHISFLTTTNNTENNKHHFILKYEQNSTCVYFDYYELDAVWHIFFTARDAQIHTTIQYMFPSIDSA